MDYRYKHLEQELSALSKVFSDLGLRLSEVAKEVTSQGVMPSEKLLEQISASRTSFENCRTAIHAHAGALLVSPLPKTGELVSIAAIDSLLKASVAAEENKFSIETEREKALAILGRVLAITHRETTEFKALQECQAKVAELRGGISSVVWPHKHPVSEKVVAGQHPALALLSFVESVDTLDDERWMTLETTITETYGKPLFVAASRGKLAVGEEAKAAVQPVVSKTPVAAPAPTPAKAPVVAPPEAPKPAAAAEKPVEKKIVAEKAPEKPAAPPPAAPVVVPAVSVEKKVAAPPAPVAPAPAAPVQAVAVERKEAAQDRTPQKPAAPPTVTAAPTPVTAVPLAPVVSIEKKESIEKPHPVAAPAALATPAVTQIPAATQIPAPAAPAAPQTAATVVSVPHAVVAPTPSPAAVPAHPAPAATVASVPVMAAPPRPQAPAPVAAQTAPAPVAASPAPAPSAAPPVVSNSHATSVPQHAAATSLSALANATESSTDKRPAAPAPAEAIDRRKEPRLAAPVPQPVGKTESNGEEFSGEEGEKAVAGDASQRPQRWGFWRGNRT
jgi:hypothetical protein